MEKIDREDARNWLAAALMGHAPAWPLAHDEGVDNVLDMARAEGVVALLHASVRDSSIVVPTTMRDALAVDARRKAAQSLYLQAQCRAVLARLDALGIPALVLKGAALAHWAYAEPYLRESGDIDLLLPSRVEVERAVAAIAPLGYVLSDEIHPGDLARFESTCVYSGGKGGLEIDLHWQLSNTPVFAFRFGWNELWKQSMALPALSRDARGLSPALSLIHACTHRCKHLAGGEDRLKWLVDMVTLARCFAAEDWHALQELSTQHGLAGVCLVNLCDAEARLGAFVPAEVLRALDLASRSESLHASRLRLGWYFQLMNVLAFPTWRMRWRWLHQTVLPGAAFLRKRYGTRSVVVALWRRMWTGLRRIA